MIKNFLFTMCIFLLCTVAEVFSVYRNKYLIPIKLKNYAVHTHSNDKLFNITVWWEKAVLEPEQIKQP